MKDIFMVICWGVCDSRVVLTEAKYSFIVSATCISSVTAMPSKTKSFIEVRGFYVLAIKIVQSTSF